MKLNWKSGVILAASMTAALFAGMFLERACTNSQIKRMNNVIEVYRGYVVSTEHMLDLLNHQYNWVDGLDHDGYYESRAEVFHLDSIALSHEQAKQEACFKMNEKFNQ